MRADGDCGHLPALLGYAGTKRHSAGSSWSLGRQPHLRPGTTAAERALRASMKTHGSERKVAITHVTNKTAGVVRTCPTV